MCNLLMALEIAHVSFLGFREAANLSDMLCVQHGAKAVVWLWLTQLLKWMVRQSAHHGSSEMLSEVSELRLVWGLDQKEAKGLGLVYGKYSVDISLSMGWTWELDSNRIQPK